MKRRVARKVIREALADRRHRRGTVLKAFQSDRIGATAYVMTLLRFASKGALQQ